MDNKTIARILRDTAQLLEIDGAIIGRYRSYEKAAEMIFGMHESIEELAKDPDKLEELPGIGERMAEHLQEILKTGDYALRQKLLKKYPATLLDICICNLWDRRRSRFYGRTSKPPPLLTWGNLRWMASCGTFRALVKRANRTF